MASWYSQLLTTTSTRISNLQRTLLASEADGDTEDDTHVCRVLRNYYAEKGRAFPSWLPPDPKAPPPNNPVFVQRQQQPAGLSSLWDNANANANPGAGLGAGAGPGTGGSLRHGRGAPAQPRNPFAAERPLSAVSTGGRPGGSPFGRDGGGTSAPPVGAGAGGGSAQDRLRQRLWGGSRTTSPSAGTGGGPFQPPPQQQQQQQQQPGRYGSAAGGWARG